MAAASALAPLPGDAAAHGGEDQDMQGQARKRKQQQRQSEVKRQGTRKSVKLEDLEKMQAELERLRMAREDADTILSSDSIFLQRLSARLHWHEQARDWVSAIGRDFWRRVPAPGSSAKSCQVPIQVNSASLIAVEPM